MTTWTRPLGQSSMDTYVFDLL